MAVSLFHLVILTTRVQQPGFCTSTPVSGTSSCVAPQFQKPQTSCSVAQHSLMQFPPGPTASPRKVQEDDLWEGWGIGPGSMTQLSA